MTHDQIEAGEVGEGAEIAVLVRREMP